jgi:hypothetical protein
VDGILLSEHVSISVIGPGLPVVKYQRFRLSMALELAKHNPVYEDIASKFFEASYFLRPECRLTLLSTAFYLHRRCHDIPRGRG